MALNYWECTLRQECKSKKCEMSKTDALHIKKQYRIIKVDSRIHSIFVHYYPPIYDSLKGCLFFLVYILIYKIYSNNLKICLQ